MYGKRVKPHRGHRAHPKASGGVPGKRTHFPAGQIDALEDFLARVVEDETGLGDHHAFAVTDEERLSDLVLEQLDALRNGGGGEVIHARRAREAALVHHIHEYLERCQHETQTMVDGCESRA
jgi:hypothetical protein